MVVIPASAALKWLNIGERALDMWRLTESWALM